MVLFIGHTILRVPFTKIYFICDVPHLMKTTRNNIENSPANLNTRNLMVSLKIFFNN